MFIYFHQQLFTASCMVTDNYYNGRVTQCCTTIVYIWLPNTIKKITINIYGDWHSMERIVWIHHFQYSGICAPYFGCNIMVKLHHSHQYGLLTPVSHVW